MIERIKAAWCVLFHREYTVFTTTTDYSKERIEKISCYIGDSNTVPFNVACENFLKACVNKGEEY